MWCRSEVSEMDCKEFSEKLNDTRDPEAKQLTQLCNQLSLCLQLGWRNTRPPGLGAQDSQPADSRRFVGKSEEITAYVPGTNPDPVKLSTGPKVL